MMKKNWLYGMLSLIMLGTGVAIASPDFSSVQIDSGEYVTAPITNDNKTDIPSGSSSYEEEITEYTYKTYDDYFIDFKIPSDITQTTIEGDGSEASPYQVNSTEDFIFLSSMNLDSKAIELNCDIILNDEVFDESGNPSGGDGVIYEWQSIMYASLLNFDGNGHSVKGLYINDETLVYAGLFGVRSERRLESVRDLNVEKFYVNAKNYVATISSYAKEVINCHVREGHVIGNSTVAGLTAQLLNKMKDCTNSAKVTASTSNAAGFFVGCGKGARIINCKNFANICVSDGKAGGIGAVVSESIVLENCENYGKIYSTSRANAMAGIIALCGGKETKVENCANYGDVTSELQGVNVITQVGSIIGFGEGDIKIINSKSTAKISNTSCGHMVGYLSSRLYCQHTKLTLQNIVVDSVNGVGLIGGVDYAKDGKDRDVFISIDGVKMNFLSDSSSVVYLLVSGIDCPKTIVNIKNVIIDSHLKSNLINLIGNLPENSSFYFENIIINNYASLGEIKLVRQNQYGKVDVGATLINYYLDSSYNSYYGSNFSSFYFKWKTGEIGLSAFGAVGFHQGKVTEEWLAGYKGYTKID